MPTAGSGSGTVLGEEGTFDLVRDVFNQAWGVAQDKTSDSTALFNAALARGADAPTMSAVDLPFSPNVQEPNVYIPTTAEGASLARFHEIADAVIDKLAGLFSGYMTQYFPNECGYLEKAQQWICDTLDTGGTGMNPVVEDQIWQRDRARVLQETNRASQDLIATFASRGFPLPPGALVHQLQQVQVEAQNKIAQASRDVAIKQAEIEISNVRFAVEQAIGLYKAAVDAAADYIKALSIGPQAGIQLVPSVTDSQSKLISAASEYYRARIAVEDLRLKASTADAEFEQTARTKNGDWTMAAIRNRVDAAIEAAKGLSQQAAAALNGLHAQASTGVQSQRGINYSYGGDVTVDVAPIP